MAERPPADPSKLLASWMEWEKGETPPGRVITNLKQGGLRPLLEDLVEAQKLAVLEVEAREAAAQE